MNKEYWTGNQAPGCPACPQSLYMVRTSTLSIAHSQAEHAGKKRPKNRM